VEDPRWKRVESQLAQHQSRLAEQGERITQTQEVVQRNGDQLDGKINSTRDELNRSIATTHDDVVQLQKRGERNIYEFDLSKSKQFQRVGPLSLSLRKADTKHRIYDLSLMVDDTALDKQHVNEAQRNPMPNPPAAWWLHVLSGTAIRELSTAFKRKAAAVISPLYCLDSEQ
jgi:hypothetical protein